MTPAARIPKPDGYRTVGRALDGTALRSPHTLFGGLMKRTIALSFFIVSLGAAAAVAAPHATPIPGGANQATGVAGTFGQRLFNGEIRLVPKELRNAVDADGLTAVTGQKWIVFTASASNGTEHALDMTQFVASVVDADGDTVQAQPNRLEPMGGVYGVPPGGQWKERIFFYVEANFVPTKLVILPYDRKHQAFRITVRPTDYAQS
jgi:hypothetical protein